MNKILSAAAVSFALAVPGFANATPVDLSGWTAQGGSSSWNVQPGNDTVLQTVNGAPTVFFDPSSTGTQGTALSGKIKVNTPFDDDYIGFALGYDSGDITSSTTDFMLIDWKQANQGAGKVGLSISHVTDATSNGDFWAHTGGVNEIQRGANLGSTGWADNTEYEFSIAFTQNIIQVMVDGNLELDITAADAGLSSFDDGSFAFYNYSQAQVLYSAITQTNCQTNPSAPECQGVSVPEPGILALIGMGLAGIGFTRRKLAA